MSCRVCACASRSDASSRSRCCARANHAARKARHASERALNVAAAATAKGAVRAVRDWAGCGGASREQGSWQGWRKQGGASASEMGGKGGGCARRVGQRERRAERALRHFRALGRIGADNDDKTQCARRRVRTPGRKQDSVNGAYEDAVRRASCVLGAGDVYAQRRARVCGDRHHNAPARGDAKEQSPQVRREGGVQREK
eukprot:3785239-Pleurochrysis_carterae.AAC.1